MRIIKAKLISGQEIEFGDINIFVGPNGTGKTTLLREIFKKSIDSPTRSLWVESVEIDEINQADATTIKDSLEEDPGEGWNINNTRNEEGQIMGGGSSHLSEEMHEALLSIERGNASSEQRQQIKEISFFRKNLIGFETTDERLSIQDEAKVGNALRATDIYNWLDNRPEIKTEIDSRFHALFGQHFSILSHLRANMYLGVSGELCPHDPSMVWESENWRKSNHIPIRESGDGMRAVIRLFFSLYDPVLRIIFIDEPEVFIYPAQRRKIAEEVKRLSAEQSKQTFLVTHDSTTLSGLVDRISEEGSVKVFYLKNRGTILEAPFTSGGSAVTPATKQTKYLEALFHRATIFVEGTDDRFLYEETMKSLYRDEPLVQDALFVDTAGADRMLEIAQLVRDTQINAVLVVDLDVLKNATKLERIAATYKKLGGSADLSSKSEQEKIEALKGVGIFVAPVPDLKDWVGRDDAFPYSAAEVLIKYPSQKGFDAFTKEIVEYFKYHETR